VSCDKQVVVTNMADMGDTGVENVTVNTVEEIQALPGPAWWWVGWSIISFLGLFLNLLFLTVVIYNRKRRDLRSLLTAVLITITVLDILDVLRIIPSLVTNLHQFNEFRITYCSLGVFHTVSISLLLILLGIYLVCPCRDAPPLYYPASTCSGSLPQKIVIPLLLLVGGGVAGVVPILPSLHSDIDNTEMMVPHSCIDHTRLVDVINSEKWSESETFWVDLYQVLVTLFSVCIPLVVIPTTILVACMRSICRGHCCQAKYKQSAGEMLVVFLVLIFYLGTMVGSVLPLLDIKMDQFTIDDKFTSVTVLWELGNGVLRPITYFLFNPAVWDGIKMLCTCCARNRSYGSLTTKEDEAALAPVVERVSSL